MADSILANSRSRLDNDILLMLSMSVVQRALHIMHCMSSSIFIEVQTKLSFHLVADFLVAW